MSDAVSLSDLHSIARVAAKVSMRMAPAPRLTLEDRVQDAWIGLLQGRRLLDTSRSAERQRAYLYRWALGSIQDSWRRQLRRDALLTFDHGLPMFDDSDDDDDDDRPQAVADDDPARLAAVRQTISRLPAHLADLFVRQANGVPQHVTAAERGVTATRICQLVADLREHLEQRL